MTAYYNEIDPEKAEWIRELIKAGVVAPGDVDERDIKLVQPNDLRGYKQCHFFAGIAGWSYALRLAGWPDDRPVWTGSCPCQPWSIANVWQGGGRGHQDSRHLLPAFVRLISECKPHTVFGEQVSGAIAKGWLDQLSALLGAENYTVGALVLPAKPFGADHERKRLYWVADAGGAGWPRHQPVKCISESETQALTITGDNFLRARRIMDHDYESLLPCNGLSAVMERSALKGYGDAIVPQVAKAFIEAYQDIREQPPSTLMVGRDPEGLTPGKER